MDLYTPETYANLAATLGYDGPIEQFAIKKLLRDSGFNQVLALTNKAKQKPMTPRKVAESPSRVAVIIILKDGKLLLGKRKDNGLWTSPAGHLLENESPEAGAYRELEEESSILLPPHTLIALPPKEIKKEGQSLTLYPFYAEISETQSASIKSDPDDEVQQWRWLSPRTFFTPFVQDHLHAPKEDNIINTYLPTIMEYTKEASFSKEAFKWYNTRSSTVDDFMRILSNAPYVDSTKSVLRGVKYRGPEASMETLFPGQTIARSTGFGEGNHYRVTDGTHKGVHLIQTLLPNGQMKIRAHKDRVVPTGIKSTLQHMVAEGAPVAISNVGSTMSTVPVVGGLLQNAFQRGAQMFSGYMNPLKKVAAEFAPGIPDRTIMPPLPTVSQQNWEFVVQEHQADKAGLHYDVRLGDPQTGKGYSWAVRKGIPQEGEKFLAIQQPPHTLSYFDFSGEITDGYGKGKVRPILRSKAFILYSSPDKIVFDVPNKGKFALIKTNGKDWLFMKTRDMSPLAKRAMEKVTNSLKNSIGKNNGLHNKNIEG
jgi:8-oxo-dGTP pyrophosphatase MutT (NUDIX family)